MVIVEEVREQRRIADVFTGADLFVGGGVGEADALDLGPGVSRRTGTTAEARGSVNAAHTHVARLHSTLSTATPQKHTSRCSSRIQIRCC